MSGVGLEGIGGFWRGEGARRSVDGGVVFFIRVSRARCRRLFSRAAAPSSTQQHTKHRRGRRPVDAVDERRVELLHAGRGGPGVADRLGRDGAEAQGEGRVNETLSGERAAIGVSGREVTFCKRPLAFCSCIHTHTQTHTYSTLTRTSRPTAIVNA